jgi:hypothetical protein
MVKIRPLLDRTTPSSAPTISFSAATITTLDLVTKLLENRTMQLEITTPSRAEQIMYSVLAILSTAVLIQCWEITTISLATRIRWQAVTTLSMAAPTFSKVTGM